MFWPQLLCMPIGLQMQQNLSIIESELEDILFCNYDKQNKNGHKFFQKRTAPHHNPIIFSKIETPQPGEN